MNRVVWFIICTAVGLELICWGLLVPAHLRAVDAQVLELTGANSPSLPEEGVALVNLEKTGPARMLLSAADQVDAPNREKLASALKSFEQKQPRARVWGGSALYLERVFEKSPATTNTKSQPIVDLLVSQNARDTLMDALRQSPRPGVLEILRTRNLTNTTIFPPARSASGQPLDATIAVTGLLFQQDHFTDSLRDSISRLVEAVNRGGPVQPLESVYLDLLALGKRLNYGQMVELVRLASSTNELHETAELLRNHEAQMPVLFAAIHLAESPHPVAQYLSDFPTTGLPDLSYALRSGTGAVRDLLQRQQPIHYPTWRKMFAAFGPIRVAYEPMARIMNNQPFFGFVVKYGLYLLGALLVARAITYLSPALVDEITSTRPFVTGPQVAIALCLLFLVLFLSESFITRAAPAVELPFRVKFPVASAALRATIPHQFRAMIDKFSASSLLVFFVLQATIYVFCRMKLAEIRRQTLPSKLKLRLLENEEHLFDAGLYFGFVGTVLALILFSLGVTKFSLMAAYSSTSFGIIFVSILKIFHLRPFRRRLILDAEMADREAQPA
jgi:hypothetical protein